MSKIFTRVQVKPFLVSKVLAEKVEKMLLEGTTDKSQILVIEHAEGRKTTSFGEIKGVDITNDNDYRLVLKENYEPQHTRVKELEVPTEEDQRVFFEKSKILKQMMGWNN